MTPRGRAPAGALAIGRNEACRSTITEMKGSHAGCSEIVVAPRVDENQKGDKNRQSIVFQDPRHPATRRAG
jgi:hypothetical protein